MAKYNDRKRGTGRGAMILKIIAGLLFIIVATTAWDDPEWTIGHMLFGVVLGIGMILWGVLPYLDARRLRRAREAAEEAERTAKILNTPLKKFGDNAGLSDEAVEKLAAQYEKPKSGIDWNRDGRVNGKDAAIEREILREEAARRGITEE